MGQLPRLLLSRLKDHRGTEFGKLRVYLSLATLGLSFASGAIIWFSNVGKQMTKDIEDGVWDYPPEHYAKAKMMWATINPKSASEIAKEIEEDRVWMDYGQKAGNLD